MKQKKLKKLVDKSKKVWYNKTIETKKIKIYRSVAIMRKQAEMKETRENVIENIINTFDLEGFEVVGRVTDGILNKDKNGYVVIKPIVKKDGFDAEDALLEYEEKQEALKQRELDKKNKVAKAKAKKE